MDSIIEEALRTILNEAVNETSVSMPENSGISSSSSEPILSNPTPLDSEPFRLRQPMTDISMISFHHEESHFQSVLSGLQNHLDDYHRNMRLYQQNITQLNRMYQNMIQANSTTRPSRQTRTSHPSNHVTNDLIRFAGMYPQGRLIEFRIPTETSAIPRMREIENATENIIYSSSLELNTRTCPITLEEFMNGEELSRIRFCRHIFKKTALLNWFSRNSHCPVCRYDILSRNSV
jgi:hypothetical protein